MKTVESVRDRLQAEIDRLPRDGGHMASITRGWIDALEWVLEAEDE